LQSIYQGTASVDPARIAAQVVSGIGFLGAGTILRFRASVRGLTTAAGLWAVAGIGLAVGSGFYVAALLSTAIIFLVLVTLSRFERKIKREIDKTLRIEANGGVKQLSEITRIISTFNVAITDVEINPSSQAGAFYIALQLRLHSTRLNSQIIEALLNIENVTAVKWV